MSSDMVLTKRPNPDPDRVLTKRLRERETKPVHGLDMALLMKRKWPRERETSPEPVDMVLKKLPEEMTYREIIAHLMFSGVSGNSTKIKKVVSENDKLQLVQAAKKLEQQAHDTSDYTLIADVHKQWVAPRVAGPSICGNYDWKKMGEEAAKILAARKAEAEAAAAGMKPNPDPDMLVLEKLPEEMNHREIISHLMSSSVSETDKLSLVNAAKKLEHKAHHTSNYTLISSEPKGWEPNDLGDLLYDEKKKWNEWFSQHIKQQKQAAAEAGKHMKQEQLAAGE